MNVAPTTSTFGNQAVCTQPTVNTNVSKQKKSYLKEIIAGSVMGCAAFPVAYTFNQAGKGQIENIPQIKTSKLIMACLLLTALTIGTIAFGHKMGQKIIEDAKNRTNTKAQ